jgi:pimeloyl-ACP methyl ester carboxylesterase
VRIRLRDGRHLGVEEHGSGRPIVWLPGTPGSRLWQPPAAEGWRFIVVERPGFGISDPQPGRRILDWPADLAEVADALSLERFVLAGNSGAGPYLHACGFRMPERISKLGVIACMAPSLAGLPLWRRAVFAAARVAPSLTTFALPRDAESFYRTLTRDVPPCDRAVVERIFAAQVEMTRDALRQGRDAFVLELRLCGADWGFRLEDVCAEVVLWHGTLDRAAPIEGAREAARRLPRCTAHFLDGAGHFLHYDRWREILESLA